jgi:site-specific DNA-methyltransferase (adenine-specific)
MKPYYEDDAVTLYHGDCREILSALAVALDVAITDPPYGIGLTTKTSDYRDSRAFDHGESLRASTLYRDDPEHVRSLVRDVVGPLVRSVSRALVFPGPRMLFAYPEPAAIGTVFMPNGAGRSAWGFQCSHPILFYGKDPYLVDGRGGRPNSFRDEQPNRDSVDHPCPKPVTWMRWAVNRASRPGEVIVDPFAGSGSTLRAAKDLNRKAIGIELEERYCEVAARRCAQDVLDLGCVA